MKIAIIGSRNFSRLEMVQKYLCLLPRETIIISGGARGVDREAERAADQLGMGKIIFQADWENLGRKAGIVRNGLIIAEADAVVAFWDGKSPGTLNSIERARAARKPLIIITPDGKSHRERC